MMARSSLAPLASLRLGLLVSICAIALPAAQTAAPGANAAPVAATASDAAPFVGDWSVAMVSQMGPTTFSLSVSTAGGKVQAKVSSDTQPETIVTDIEKAGPSLVLSYSFDYQGNQVPTVITLTPDAGGKIKADFDFANGAFQMSGTGEKKAAH